MKKILFAILVVLTTQSFAQKHVPYLSVGPQFSVSPKYRATSYSIEGGLVLGAQHTKGVNFSPQVGINLVYLFTKKS